MDVVGRAEQITTNKFSFTQLEKSDISIQPDFGLIDWSEFERIDEIVAVGEKAAKEQIAIIKDSIKKHNSNLLIKQTEFFFFND